MDQKQMMKQMIVFNKAAFDNAFKTMNMLHDQTERMTNMFLEQANWLPAEGRQMIEEWVKMYKTGRENFKISVDEAFKRVETFFSEPEQKD